MNPHKVTQDFERCLAEYTGAPFAVATTSCTTALLIALMAIKQRCQWIEIPRLTYVGVAASVKNAGFELRFRDQDWQGAYRLEPTNIWDSARRLTSGMYVPDTVMCLSFHWAKHLSIGQGGAILTDNADKAELFRKMRCDGRTEGVDARDDNFVWPSFHAYMMPRDAAEGLTRLSLLPKDNPDLPRSDYPDLSKLEAFK